MLNHAKTTLSVFTMLAFTGAAQAGIASTIVLDGFDNDPNNDAGGPGDFSSIIISNPFNQGADFTLDPSLDTGGDIGAVIFNSGIGVDQLGTISYSNTGAGLDLDAAALGVLGFELDFAMVDQRFDAEIVLFTYDNMGNGIGNARQTISVDEGSDILASWLLADFSFSGAFDASDVDEVRIEFNQRTNPTTSLDFIATEFRAVVPSPGSAALLGLGGIVMTRRKRG